LGYSTRSPKRQRAADIGARAADALDAEEFVRGRRVARSAAMILCNGKVPALDFAMRYGSRIHPLGFKTSHQKTDDDVFRSVEDGGWIIP